MEAPERGLTREELDAAIDAWITEHCIFREGIGFCNVCGDQVLTKTLYATPHPGRYGVARCGGGGDVEHFQLPYCPTCEGEPADTETCIHALPARQAS